MIKRYSAALGLAFLVTAGIFLIIQALISMDVKDIDRSEVIRTEPKLVKINLEKEIEAGPITIICVFPSIDINPKFESPEVELEPVENVKTLVNIPSPQLLVSDAPDQISGEMLTFKPIRLDQTEVIFPDGIEQTAEEFVIVKYTITQHGETEDVVISESSDRRFERSALDAVEAFEFVPILHEGQAVIVKDVLQRINYFARERR